MVDFSKQPISISNHYEPEEVRRTIEQLIMKAQALREALDGYVEDITTDITALDGRVDTLETNLASLTITVGTHTTTLASHTTTLGTHTTQIGTLQTTVTTIQGDITDLDTRVDALETTAATHTTDIATHTTQIGTLSSGLTATQLTVAGHTTAISNLQTDVTTLQSTVSSHTSSISSLTTTVSSHTTTLSSHATTLSTHTTDISNLQSADTALDGRLDTIEAWTFGSGLIKTGSDIAVELATTAPGLEFSGDRLRVKVLDPSTYPSQPVVRDSDGVWFDVSKFVIDTSLTSSARFLAYYSGSGNPGYSYTLPTIRDNMFTKTAYTFSLSWSYLYAQTYTPGTDLTKAEWNDQAARINSTFDTFSSVLTSIGNKLNELAGLLRTENIIS